MYCTLRFSDGCKNTAENFDRLDFHETFSFPEATLLLVSTKNRDLWPGPTPEVCNSQTFRHSAHAQSQVWLIWLVLVSIYCVYKAIQNWNVVALGQRSRFSVLTKRNAALGTRMFMRMNLQVTCIFIRLVSHKDTFAYSSRSRLREPFILPCSCTAFSQALAVNWFQWRISDERPGVA